MFHIKAQHSLGSYRHICCHPRGFSSSGSGGCTLGGGPEVLTHIYHVSHHKPGHEKVLNRHTIAGANESY